LPKCAVRFRRHETERRHRAIKEKHAPIAGWFERGHGLRFMRTESDLIVAVTLSLLKRGVVALPIHDAVAVPRSCAETAKAVMQAEAKRLTAPMSWLIFRLQQVVGPIAYAFGAKRTSGPGHHVC